MYVYSCMHMYMYIHVHNHIHICMCVYVCVYMSCRCVNVDSVYRTVLARSFKELNVHTL